MTLCDYQTAALPFLAQLTVILLGVIVIGVISVVGIDVVGVVDKNQQVNSMPGHLTSAYPCPHT